MPKRTLILAYEDAVRKHTSGEVYAFEESIEQALELVMRRSESAKGVYTVLLTSIVYKLLHPDQDIRKHQASILGGYSGRSFDSQYITPFLKEQGFPAMAESGWLTRSLEQKVPYDRDYPGAISPKKLKDAFLDLIAFVESCSKEDLNGLLVRSFVYLIKQREEQQMSLAVPRNLNIVQILSLLESHWSSKYLVQGTARLPVLAIYAVYRLLIDEVKRFERKVLLDLESHNSADKRSGRMGDIDIVDNLGFPFEAVEVKHMIPLGIEHIQTAYDKFKSYDIKRYYILSTSPIKRGEEELVEKRTREIKNTHGCQVIVNGIYSTLKYYLRLLEDPNKFLEAYVCLLEQDATVKFEHRVRWNQLVEELSVL